MAAIHRFRVVRTLDLTALCFPERNFKAALVAAQRAMRQLKKNMFVRPFITDRKQHVYGLTPAGAQQLHEQGLVGTASVRRVADMTNPEHLLWANFLVMCCEARGLSALTETELLRDARLKSKGTSAGHGQTNAPAMPSLMDVPQAAGSSKHWRLRPDAICYEPDGATWFEVDRSRRGADRVAKLGGLIRCIGRSLKNGESLRRVILFAKTARVWNTDLAALRSVGIELRPDAKPPVGDPPGTVYYTEAPQTEAKVRCFTISGFRKHRQADGRTAERLEVLGYVIVQVLPLNLARFRVDVRNREGCNGWFDENYLPYARPVGMAPWAVPTSPLLEGEGCW
ncbi:replication-relaxation family protein [Xylophilus sp. GW821-FHT01B05]